MEPIGLVDRLYWVPEAELTGYTGNQRLKLSGLVILGTRG